MTVAFRLFNVQPFSSRLRQSQKKGDYPGLDTNPKRVHIPSMTFRELEKRFPTETACLDYLVSMRWADGVACPRCGNAKVYKLKAAHRWSCKACNPNGYRFSPIAGTIFENTNIKLRTWFHAIFLMCQSKKGVSALQVHRMIGTGSYETAWYMCHRIRAAMQDGTFGKLMGEVEVDETYIGGRSTNRHAKDRKRLDRRSESGKVTVIGAISRKGNVVCKLIERADRKTMEKFVSETVSERVSLLATDEHSGYAKLGSKGYKHEAVTHSGGEYVRKGVYGVVHTANLDSFWALLKRGIVGSFHHVSKDYLPLYLNEFSFRFNRRNDRAIFDAIVAGC
ncbi:MAG TPA: IS1595 family transposase [Candidatus Binatia bacterium]|nr:IS1595 family transposase [Candidatus Binatia bacterium]